MEQSMNPFFSYERTPVFTEINGEKIQLPKEVIVNTETMNPVGVVSKNYELIPNEDLANMFEDVFDKYNISDRMDYINKGGENWKRRIIFEDDRLNFEVVKGDNIKICLDVFNSYSGKTSYGCEISAIRDFCTNGMVFGKHSIFDFKFSHFRNNLDVIKKNFEIGSNNVGANIIPIWKKWTELSFTMNDMSHFLDSRKYITNDKNKERVLEKYEEIMNKEGHSETRWGAFNTLTYISTHETNSRRDDTSHIFSNAYRKYERLASDMYSLPDDLTLTLPK